MCRVPKRSCLWMREREKNWSWQPESHMLFHTACWTIIYLFIFLCWHLAKHAPRCRHTKRSWEKKREPQRKNHFKKKKIHLFKRHRMKGAKVAVQTAAVAADSNPKPPAISAWTPFLVCKQIRFFFLFYLVFPPVKIRGEIQVNNMHLFIFLSFFFFFSPFQSVSFPPTPQTQFFLGVHRLECFFSLPRSRLLFIRQQSFNLYH